MNSILDNDLYKFTMHNAVLALFPNTWVRYEFRNRNTNQKVNYRFLSLLRSRIDYFEYLTLKEDEKDWLEKSFPFINPRYFSHLKNFKYRPEQVSTELVNVDSNGFGDLKMEIKGLWADTILWEVPLLALISECYFEEIDKNWNDDNDSIKNRIIDKGKYLGIMGCRFADFGTRRRRNFKTQDIVVRELSNFPRFVGTSNVFLAKKYGVKALGTVAHEWTMAHQVLSSIKHCDRYALKNWQKVYNGELGIALTDTLGTDHFYEDFDPTLSRLFDGVRHDSGDPFEFVDKTVAHYQYHRIDPMSKTIIFSDGLNVEKAIKISSYCTGKIKCSFGIGTNFTNDFDNSPAMNIVIKLAEVDDMPVVKLSDEPTKAIGDPDALRVTKWIVDRTPLDAK